MIGLLVFIDKFNIDDLVNLTVSAYLWFFINIFSAKIISLYKDKSEDEVSQI